MRKWNFSAGPAAIPEAVLQEAQAEMLEWQGSGMSVMEMSHRSSDYIDIANKAREDLIDLLNIPSNYQVLFEKAKKFHRFFEAFHYLNHLSNKLLILL